MINSIIALKKTELEKDKVISGARNLHRAKLITNEQLEQIKKAYTPDLYTPSSAIRILLFIFSLIGMLTFTGPMMLIFNGLSTSEIQKVSLFWGTLLIFLTEYVLIKGRRHFNSGVTEAGLYSGIALIAFGILEFDSPLHVVYALVGFILALFAAIRYLNLTALASALLFLIWLVFELLTAVGGTVQALTPLVLMSTMALIYAGSKKLQKKLSSVAFGHQFILLDTMALLLFYLAGNYFVVRELSAWLINPDLSSTDNIPFAFLFYVLTALVPVGYIYLGITKRSVMLLRVGLLTLALSVITLKYYHASAFPILTLTLAGALLIVVALLLFNFLKQIRGGFTREMLLHDKWASSNLGAFIASQTLGGNKPGGNTNDTTFGGGKFGGAGAGENW